MVVRNARRAASQSGALKSACDVNATPRSRWPVDSLFSRVNDRSLFEAAADLAAVGHLHCTIEYLGPEVVDAESATASVDSYLKLLEALRAADSSTDLNCR